jgi:phosphatidylserine decarboxylase
MDPFVVVSYGTSSFRTSSVRHNLNPVWNDKLFFHVRKTDTNYHLKFTVYDKETFSANNLVAWCQMPIQDIINQTETTEDDENDDMPMNYHTFPLQMSNAEKWRNKRPTLTIRFKFMPYNQVRKMFWLHLAKAYDAEHTNTLSKLQVQSMLETIGSTITEATIDSFWKSFQKDPDTNELTINELVESLENHMKADAYWHSDKLLDMRHLSIDDNENVFDNAFNGEWDDDDDDEEADDEILDISSDEDDDNNSFDFLDPEMFNYSNVPPTDEELDVDLAEILIQEEDKRVSQILPPRDYKPPARRQATVEKVIRLNECPICHRRNMARKSQMDIITHVATCAAKDWTTVDRFLMGDFLTEAYAQRRWFVKLVRKVSYGKYSLGRVRNCDLGGLLLITGLG